MHASHGPWPEPESTGSGQAADASSCLVGKRYRSKEYYFYLDSTPTRSYMKYLFKYPQAAFPYQDLVETNQCRSQDEMEYELIDTGIFNKDRLFSPGSSQIQTSGSSLNWLSFLIHNQSKPRNF